MRPVYVGGSGTFLPGEPIPVDQIGEVLGQVTQAPAKVRRWIARSEPLIQELLDIKFVHYALDPKTRRFTEDAVSMAVKACQSAAAMAGITPQEDVDLICYGSPHQDQMPTASVRIQEQLGINTCDELSIHANCTSAYKALYLAHMLIAAGRNHTALVVSSNVASSELRAEYLNQPLLDKESLFLRWFLCDGAGALVLSDTPLGPAPLRVEATYIESIGGGRPSLMWNNRPAYWMNPKEEFEKGHHHLRQQFRNSLGTEVFQEHDGSIFFKGLKRMIEKEQLALDGVRFLQINMPTKHIVSSILDECEALGIKRSALFTKLDSLGYCGPPMALMGLDSILREERLQKGDQVLSFVTEVSKFMQAGYCMRR